MPFRLFLCLCTIVILAACGSNNAGGGSSCRSAEDCGGNTCSVAGRCVTVGDCAEDGDCHSFEQCTDNVCEPRPPCTTDEECGSGFFCSSDRRCLIEGDCEAHADCDDGERCSSANNKCIAAGSCVNDSDCDALQACDEIGNCHDIAVCASDTVGSEHVPANALLLLDRSCSMQGPIFARGPSKWETAVRAVNRMIDRYTGANWGLELFPEHRDARPRGNGQRACDVLDITLNIGEDNGPTIQDLLTGALEEDDLYYPAESCSTPMESALFQAQNEPGFNMGGNPGYVIFLTDGKPVCKLDPPLRGTKPAYWVGELRDMGIDTFVIGFGGGDISPTILNEMAEAGGRARAGETKYYFAEDDASLEATFDEIASSITSCDFSVERPLENLSETYVLLNDTDTLDQGTDWDYDGARGVITVKGNACDRVRNGADVRVVQGCPGVNPE